MSTNYHLVRSECENACAHCNHESLLHIGKTYGAGGGKLGVILRAYDVAVETPVGTHDIMDWSTWKQVLLHRDAQVQDEYGRAVSTAWLIMAIEGSPHEARGRQARQYPSGHDFVDREGFSCCLRDFS